MSKYSYVVVRQGFEYNDEIYFKPNLDGDSEGSGKPMKIFSSQEKAEAYCKKMNGLFIKEIFEDKWSGIDHYTYDDPMELISDVPKFIQCLRKISTVLDGIEDNDIDWSKFFWEEKIGENLKKKIPAEAWEDLASVIDLYSYEVVRCEVAS